MCSVLLVHKTSIRYIKRPVKKKVYQSKQPASYCVSLSYEALFIFLNFILAQCNRESLEPATISFILRGMCAPNIDTIYRLARGLGLAPHEFLKP